MRRGRPITGCGAPRWINTKRGKRCAAVCDGGMWQFKPGSACAQALEGLDLVGTYTGPEIKATRKGKKRRSRRK